MSLLFIILIFALVGVGFYANYGDKCPNCNKRTDDEFHGYNRLYSHCHHCGECTQPNCTIDKKED